MHVVFNFSTTSLDWHTGLLNQPSGRFEENETNAERKETLSNQIMSGSWRVYDTAVCPLFFSSLLSVPPLASFYTGIWTTNAIDSQTPNSTRGVTRWRYHTFICRVWIRAKESWSLAGVPSPSLLFTVTPPPTRFLMHQRMHQRQGWLWVVVRFNESFYGTGFSRSTAA